MTTFDSFFRESKIFSVNRKFCIILCLLQSVGPFLHDQMQLLHRHNKKEVLCTSLMFFCLLMIPSADCGSQSVPDYKYVPS